MNFETLKSTNRVTWKRFKSKKGTIEIVIILLKEALIKQEVKQEHPLFLMP